MTPDPQIIASIIGSLHMMSHPTFANCNETQHLEKLQKIVTRCKNRVFDQDDANVSFNISFNNQKLITNENLLDQDIDVILGSIKSDPYQLLKTPDHQFKRTHAVKINEFITNELSEALDVESQEAVITKLLSIAACEPILEKLVTIHNNLPYITNGEYNLFALKQQVFVDQNSEQIKMFIETLTNFEFISAKFPKQTKSTKSLVTINYTKNTGLMQTLVVPANHTALIQPNLIYSRDKKDCDPYFIDVVTERRAHDLTTLYRSINKFAFDY